MALNPGTTLGPAEVLSAIGAGGMGEVYKARDTTPDRDVAIKALPDGVATVLVVQLEGDSRSNCGDARGRSWSE